MGNQLGIVFTGGEGPGPQAISRLLAGLEAGALIVAADCGLGLAEAAGLSPDWIVGDMDSLGSESRLAKYPGERVVRHAAEKDHSDTEMALSLLWEKGCTKAKWNRAVERNGRWLRLKQEARRTLESEQHAELGK